MTSQLPTLMDGNLLILGAAPYMNTYNRSKPLLVWADSVKLEYPGKIQILDQVGFFRNHQIFPNWSMKNVDYIYFV